MKSWSSMRRNTTIQLPDLSKLCVDLSTQPICVRLQKPMGEYTLELKLTAKSGVGYKLLMETCTKSRSKLAECILGLSSFLTDQETKLLLWRITRRSNSDSTRSKPKRKRC